MRQIKGNLDSPQERSDSMQLGRWFWAHQRRPGIVSSVIKICKTPGNGTRPGPKSTQIFWKISRLVPIFFFGTKFFWDRFRDFFRYLIFPRPVPRLFSVPIFFETGSETFFGTKFFRFRFRYHQKNWRIPGNGNSRDRDVTLCRPGHHPE